MKQPWAKVWQEKMPGVGLPGLCEVKAAIEKHRFMLHENYTDGFLSCQYGIAVNPQKHWRHKGTAAHPSD
jgi:hypothetical protein